MRTSSWYVRPVALICAVPALAALAACAANAESFGSPTANAGSDRSDASTSGKFGEGGTSSDAGVNSGAATDAGATSIVLVHASKNLPAFRVCFDARTNVLPQPDDKVMPNANVVGVDVAAAVHIGSLDMGAMSGVGSADAAALDLDGAADDGGSEASTAADASVTGQLYVMEEKLVRGFYPQGTDAQAGPDCGAIVKVLQDNGYEGHGLYTLTGDEVMPLLGGTQFIVVAGCLPDPTLGVAECGQGFTTTNGNLHYQIVTVTPPSPVDGQIVIAAANFSPGAATASLALNDGTGMAASQLAVPADGTLSTPTVLPLPTTDGAYDTAGVTINPPAGAPVKLSLAQIQAASSPRELPSHFFGLQTSFAFFIVGDPNVSAMTSPTQALHVLAVPMTDPSTLAAANDQ